MMKYELVAVALSVCLQCAFVESVPRGAMLGLLRRTAPLLFAGRNIANIPHPKVARTSSDCRRLRVGEMGRSACA